MWASGASAEEESWFDQEPEKATNEESASEDAPAPQDGEVDTESKSASYLTKGRIALTAGVHLGLGGSVNVDVPGPLDAEDDLATTIGLQLGGEYVLHPYFALGGELRLSGINTKSAADADVGRDMLTDIVVKPRGRYVFESIGLEAYLAMPFGLSIPNINDKKGGEASMGFTLGTGLGATYFFSDKIGIGSDFSWLWHWYGIEETNLTNNDKVSSTVKLGQFTWFVNAVYAL
jgi:hypothetical protein